MGKQKKARGLDLSQRRSPEEREAERENVREYRRAAREPYDPQKEVVVGQVAKIAVDRAGKINLFVEHIRYNGEGPTRVRMQRRGTRQDGTTFETNNIGFMQPAIALLLADALKNAVATLPAEAHEPG